MRLFSPPHRVDAIRAAELLERVEVVVLDVRENVEWKVGRIPGALHIPLAQVPFRGRELPRDTTIVTVCRSGHRSGLAARWLRHAGHRVEDLDGGMKAWAPGASAPRPDRRPSPLSRAQGAAPGTHLTSIRADRLQAVL